MHAGEGGAVVDSENPFVERAVEHVARPPSLPSPARGEGRLARAGGQPPFAGETRQSSKPPPHCVLIPLQCYARMRASTGGGLAVVA
jgi:hypothetical protein